MKLKIEIFPADNVDVDSMLNELSRAGFIQRYEINKTKYIQIVKFSKHQNPHINETPSTIPAPEEHSTTQEKADTTHADSFISDSLNPDSGTPDSSNPVPPENILGDKPKKNAYKEQIEQHKTDMALQDIWPEYLKMRKGIKKPATEYAEYLGLEKLAKFSQQGHDPKQIIENSISNSWAGLFEPRQDNERSRKGSNGTGKPLVLENSFERNLRIATENERKRQGMEPDDGEILGSHEP